MSGLGLLIENCDFSIEQLLIPENLERLRRAEPDFLIFHFCRILSARITRKIELNQLRLSDHPSLPDLLVILATKMQDYVLQHG